MTPTVPHEVRKLLEEGRQFIVASHFDPDGDAIGSTLAMGFLLEAMGKQVVLHYNRDSIPYNLRFLEGSDRVSNILPETTPGTVDTVIVLDCSEPHRVSQEFSHYTDRVRQRGAKLITLDHHATASDDADARMHDLNASAAGLLVMRLVRHLDIPLSRRLGEALYTAIVTDTGSFRYASTSAEAHRAAADCIDAGVNPWVLSEELYEKEPAARIQLLGRVLSSMRFSEGGRCVWMGADNETLAEVEASPAHLDGFVNYGRSIDGVYSSMLIRENGAGRWKASMRSRDPVNVARIAEQFGGGGHRNAAGAVVEARTMDEAVEKLQQAVKSEFDKVDL